MSGGQILFASYAAGAVIAVILLTAIMLWLTITERGRAFSGTWNPLVCLWRNKHEIEPWTDRCIYCGKDASRLMAEDA